ncbi:glycoside hydrolase superfamily [Sporodiniella umbellata]|nr:glycoside hydrolase superfamily [Sporodiniella umbellata]
MHNKLALVFFLCLFLINVASTASHKTKSLSHNRNGKHFKHHHSRSLKAVKKTNSKHTTKKTNRKTKKVAKKNPKKTNSDKSYPKHKIVAYVLDWDIPKNVKWGEVDHLAYAFAEPDVKGNLKNFDSHNLKSVVTQAHKHNVGVSISVAGWSGSIHMSTLLNSELTRNVLAKNIVNMITKFSLDGVNLDWEFPNSPNSISCASRNPNDTDNFLILIKTLRQMMDKKFPKAHKVITVAASNNPFADSRGYATRKFDAAWASTVDYFYLMSYEYSGSWSNVAGPNAALRGSNHGWGVQTSVDLWYNAGIPKSKIHVGVSFYGKALKTSQAITSTSGMYVKLDGHKSIQGDKYDELASDPCPNAVPGYTGEYQWRSIVSNGILDNKNGWTSYWDEQSQTPYAYNAKNSVFLTYDNPKSLTAKADYVKNQGLAGFMVWSLEMDDSKHALLTAIQSIRK